MTILPPSKHTITYERSWSGLFTTDNQEGLVDTQAPKYVVTTPCRRECKVKSMLMRDCVRHMIRFCFDDFGFLLHYRHYRHLLRAYRFHSFRRPYTPVYTLTIDSPKISKNADSNNIFEKSEQPQRQNGNKNTLNRAMGKQIFWNVRQVKSLVCLCIYPLNAVPRCSMKSHMENQGSDHSLHTHRPRTFAGYI